MDVGLGYLTLNRLSNTLSGGESQRINLATSLGSSLVGSLYILDEPSIGLHSRDTDKLIKVLRQLQQLGNTVVVVEHDEEIIRAADYIIDIGPKAGRLGGEVVYHGDMKDLQKGSNSYTVKYLLGEETIPLPLSHRSWNNYIEIKGARENNLKNINITLPKDKLIVMTGVSGSGKSSLAFDTIYAEGQRRYIESLSAYARQFLGGSEKPDVDSIDGLSPAISIDQKTTNKNPRSTVGTVTEIYDYLRLLFARIGVPYCPRHHIPISSQSIEEMVNDVLKLPERTKIRVLGPVVALEKGTHKDLLLNLRKEGYVRVIIDDKEYDLSEDINLEKNKKHTIEVVVDRLVIKPEIRSRLYESMEVATKLGSGKILIDVIGGEKMLMSETYACPECDFSLPELEPRMFSFNAPWGACPECKGLGIKNIK